MNVSTSSDGPLEDEDEVRHAVIEAAQALPNDDDDENQTFRTAMSVAADLVMSESDPLKFFRIESGSLERAARRLVAYWALREKIFGERAFLPLDLSGQGAMNESDIHVLRSGCLMLLPKDSRGRNIMFFDRTKDVQLQGQEPEGSVTIVHKPRCSFYLLSVASEEDTPLVFVSYGDSPKWGIGKRQGSQAVFSTIPIELDGYLSLFSLPEGATRGFKHAVVPVYENFIREQNYGCEHATYVRESSSDFVVALANHGLSSQNLPRVAGGTWTHQDFLMWLESRRLKEQGRRSDLDSKVPARRARIASPSSSVLSSGLLLTAQECLRESDSPSNDFAGKLLLLHMLKKLNQSTGRTAYLPVLELSDQTSALGKYLAELEQKRRRERNCRDEIMELLETPLENLPAPSSSGFSNDLLSWSLAHEGITSSVEGTLAKLSGSPLTSGTNGMTNGEAGCHGDFSENDIHRLLVDLALGLNSRPIKRSCTADEGRDQLGPAREFLKELMERRNDAHLLSREEARERQEETTTLETLDYIIESTL